MRKFKACLCLELALVFACISVVSARPLSDTKRTDVVALPTGQQPGPNVNETALNSTQSLKNSTKKTQILQDIQPEDNTSQKPATASKRGGKSHTNKTTENMPPTEDNTSQKPTTGSKRGGKSHTNKTTKKKQTTVTLSKGSTMAGKRGEKAGTDETTENNQPPKKSAEEEYKDSSALKDLTLDETKHRRKGDSQRGFPGPKSNEHQSSHFAAIFLTSIVLVFAIYVVYHNRQKVIAVVIEGRSNENGKRRGYRKLETNVHEAMPSMKNANSTYVY